MEQVFLYLIRTLGYYSITIRAITCCRINPAKALETNVPSDRSRVSTLTRSRALTRLDISHDNRERMARFPEELLLELVSLACQRPNSLAEPPRPQF
jgi:hypothetical protein